jgi:hypothetical protein
MKNKYEQIVAIHRRAAVSSDATPLAVIVPLFESWGIRKRQDDGELLWTNISMPTTVAGTIVVGYRYRKRDASFTEDLFELKQSNPNEVLRRYKGSYQKICAEYAKTHKQQNVEARSFTSVNTCCLYLGLQNGS